MKVRFLGGMTWIVLMGLVGCGSGDGRDLVTVQGTVDFDGRPIDEGQVIMRPADTDTDADVAPIAEGKFRIRTTPGPKIVELLAYRDTPEIDNMTGKPFREQYLPPRYNKASEEKITVPEGGGEPISFQLGPNGKGR